jgi:micrococcal nuclease
MNGGILDQAIAEQLMKIKVLILLAIIAQSFTIQTLAETLTGRVISVGDGDTIRVRTGEKTLTVRLACINSAEVSQKPYGERAASRLKQLLPTNTPVSLNIVDSDRYGRSVALVNKGDLSINLALVQEGQAVVYQKYLDNCPELKDRLLAAEATAQKKRLNFWSQNNPTMPWDWREENRPSPQKPLTFPENSTSLPVCVNSDCDCSDFRNRAEAQRVLNAYPNDPFRLDADKDGIPCESLK